MFRLNEKITLDLDRVLTIAAIKNGVRLTYLNSEEETIAPISSAQRDRLLDHWLAG